MTEREQFIAELKALTAFFEERPEFPVPFGHNTFNIMADSKEGFAALLKQLGTFTKDPSERYFSCRREFGDKLAIDVFAERGKVCEKRTVMKEVEEYICPDSLLKQDS